MDPVEELRKASLSTVGPSSKFPIQEKHKLAEDKKAFMVSVAKDMGDPHFPTLHLNINENSKSVQIDRILYDGTLQERLASWKKEKDKMIVMAGTICNNNLHKLVNGGGHVYIGLVLDNPVDKLDHNGFRVIEDNPIAQRNEIAFRTLKGTSVYEKYIFFDVKGDNVLGVYDTIYYMLPDVRHVKTYTIVYVVGDSTIREVTLHDFGKYGNILTKIDLKLQ